METVPYLQNHIKLTVSRLYNYYSGYKSVKQIIMPCLCIDDMFMISLCERHAL